MTQEPALTTEEPVLVSEREGVLEITLNRPHVRNAVNQQLSEAVAAALDRLDSDDQLRVGIITGAAGVFCSGMDLKAFATEGIPWAPDRGFAGVVVRGSTKPLIAAVEGYALAGGFEVALSCDLIVAARDARFGIPEVKRGLLATGGALARLPKRIPYHFAMELALTGDQITAVRAAEMGIVNRLAEAGQALTVARDLAGTMIANAPLAVAASKAIVQRAIEWTEEELWERQAEIGASVNASEDAREGASAFAEKRPPVWRSR